MSHSNTIMTAHLHLMSSYYLKSLFKNIYISLFVCLFLAESWLGTQWNDVKDDEDRFHFKGVVDCDFTF